MVYDVYLRRGKDTLHAFRWNGHQDRARANRLFQEMIEKPLYAATLKPWDTLVLIPPNHEVGRKFPRLKDVPRTEA
jgi:hypothetical protein